MDGKQYLGDSVYAEVECGMVKLTTENGEGPSNTIYLDSQVLNALSEFCVRSLEVGRNESS